MLCWRPLYKITVAASVCLASASMGITAAAPSPGDDTAFSRRSLNRTTGEITPTYCVIEDSGAPVGIEFFGRLLGELSAVEKCRGEDVVASSVHIYGSSVGGPSGSRSNGQSRRVPASARRQSSPAVGSNGTNPTPN